MHDAGDNPRPFGPRLSDAIREVRSAAADREDVVIDMRDAERMRLELLANELAPVIADVPPGVDLFDFALTSGLQPRFWIDAVSHVAMGRDKRTYRFLRDTRLGRTVLAESADMKTVAERVTRYLAERLVERERMMAGDVVDYSGRPAAGFDTASPSARATSRDWSSSPAASSFAHAEPAHPHQSTTAPHPSAASPYPSAYTPQPHAPSDPAQPYPLSHAAPRALPPDQTPGQWSFPTPANPRDILVGGMLQGALLVAAGIAAGLMAAILLHWDRLAG